MSKTSPHRPQRLEVTIVFEPHRLQDDLLQTAYAVLVPQSRRRLAAAPSSPAAPHARHVQSAPDSKRSAS